MHTHRVLEFYHTDAGRYPVLDFIESIHRPSERAKIMRVFDNIEVMPLVPVNFLKKLKGGGNLWEIRVRDFRFLGFYPDSRRLLLLHAFVKQSQKTPIQDIQLAASRQRLYLATKR